MVVDVVAVVVASLVGLIVAWVFQMVVVDGVVAAGVVGLAEGRQLHM